MQFSGRSPYLSFSSFLCPAAADAAGPLFADTDVHLTKNDATFVDVIHTSAGDKTIRLQLGILPPIGHVDFYPNGGTKQRGCLFFGKNATVTPTSKGCFDDARPVLGVSPLSSHSHGFSFIQPLFLHTHRNVYALPLKLDTFCLANQRTEEYPLNYDLLQKERMGIGYLLC